MSSDCAPHKGRFLALAVLTSLMTLPLLWFLGRHMWLLWNAKGSAQSSNRMTKVILLITCALPMENAIRLLQRWEIQEGRDSNGSILFFASALLTSCVWCALYCLERQTLCISFAESIYAIQKKTLRTLDTSTALALASGFVWAVAFSLGNAQDSTTGFVLLSVVACIGAALILFAFAKIIYEFCVKLMRVVGAQSSELSLSQSAHAADKKLLQVAAKQLLLSVWTGVSLLCLFAAVILFNVSNCLHAIDFIGHIIFNLHSVILSARVCLNHLWFANDYAVLCHRCDAYFLNFTFVSLPAASPR